jgi:hypothetical protein
VRIRAGDIHARNLDITSINKLIQKQNKTKDKHPNQVAHTSGTYPEDPPSLPPVIPRRCFVPSEMAQHKASRDERGIVGEGTFGTPQALHVLFISHLGPLL